MPEIVEIRKYADFLKRKLKNKTINEIKILKGRYKTHGPFQNYYSIIKKLPLKVLDVKTKGKFLYFIFEDDYYLFSTLGLHGGWVFYNNDTFQFNTLIKYAESERMEKYRKSALNNLNVEFVTKYGSIFYFDTLSFGTLKIIKGDIELNKKLNLIGPDIMEPSTTINLFTERLLKSKNLNKKIGIVLMDQKVISGIGNYLRADVLWSSKISPFRKVKDLTEKEINNIYNITRTLTWASYDYPKGIKLKTIKKNIKLPYTYKRNFFVYGQENDIYGNKIIKKELFEGSQKRFIYYVKELQL